ncbi:MAG TPA: helix-turn-helix transcriptional regulator [Solimonas sp.]
MPDVAFLLKSEIVRLSKKVVRQEVGALRTATTSQRRQIASLKKQVATLEREIARLRNGKPAKAAASEDGDGRAAPRYVAKGLRPLRTRLGLTMDEFGKLIGVSGQSVYNWERAKVRPRATQIAAIAELRSLGKKAARAKLEAMG